MNLYRLNEYEWRAIPGTTGLPCFDAATLSIAFAWVKLAINLCRAYLLGKLHTDQKIHGQRFRSRSRLATVWAAQSGFYAVYMNR